MEKLGGYKTYIVAGAAALATGAYHLGYIDETLYGAVMTFLGIGGAVTLRQAISKAGK